MEITQQSCSGAMSAPSETAKALPGSGPATPSLMTWPKFPDLSALVSWSLKWHHTQRVHACTR